MTVSPKQSRGKLAANRKALRDYLVLERLEAGVVLLGTEVKSVKNAEASLVGAYAQVENGEVVLHGFTIQAYEHGNRFNHDPDRPKRLLLHRREIERLAVALERFDQSRCLIGFDLAACYFRQDVLRRHVMNSRT